MPGWSIVALLIVLAPSVLSASEYEDEDSERWERSVDAAAPKLNLLSLGSKMNSGPRCRRACTPGAPPLVCRYHFVLEHYNTMGLACRNCPNNARDCYERQCVTTDGIERGILTVNRRMPGPSIQVCEGDTIVVDVENRVPGQTTAIHWHGVLQQGSPYMDGVPMLTQCPIVEGTSFRYIYNASEIGTFFWHSHDGFQKMDGVTGGLIVRSPRDRSIGRYDWDLQQHVVLIQDWLHQYTAERLPGPRGFRRGQRPDALLINGRGRFINPVTNESNGVPLAEFRVSPGFRYRFRIIHAGCLICPLHLSVQNHRITLIATDGSPVRPVTADSLTILPGERYDVVIRTNQPVATYVIHLKALGECNETQIYQEALLRYEGANLFQATPSVGYTGFPEGRILNPLNAACGPGQNGVCVHQLRAELPNPGDETPKSSLFTSTDIVQVTMGFDFKLFSYNDQFRSKQFYRHYEPATPSEFDLMVAGRMNQVSLALPPSPVLSQPEAWRQLCTSGSPRCCDNLAPFSVHRECFNVISVPLGATVEILFLDNMETNRTLTHPIHVHGFMFAVTAMGTRQQKLRGMARDSGVLQSNPAMKDTVAVPSGGFVRVRFVASNPGYWLIHCHVLFHLDTGMAAVLRVGEQTDLPPVPDNFPRCGNFLPPY